MAEAASKNQIMDVEAGDDGDTQPRIDTFNHEEQDPRQNGSWQAYLKSFERTLVAYNLETRGIKRVEPDERQDISKRGFLQIFVLWFSVNLAANNITLGMLGPAIFVRHPSPLIGDH